MTEYEKTDYTNQNHPSQDQYTTDAQAGQSHPVTLRKRIGSTTYRVFIYFNETAREALQDKVFRLIQNAVEMGEEPALAYRNRGPPSCNDSDEND